MSVFFPLLAYFLPYLLIKYVWKMPIPYEMYTKIMGHMMNFSFDSSPEKILQTMFTIFTLGQSVYQPIQNAFHLHKINITIYNLGKNIQEYSNLIENLQLFLIQKNIEFKFTKSLENLEEYRRNFVEIIDNPSRIHFVSKNLSLFEVLWNLSNNNDFTKVTFYESSTPYFKAISICDINLSKDSRIGSSIQISNTKHFLLSGPNGGGKSSFLRSVLQTLLFSQSFGYAYGESIELCVFDYILSGLNIQDSPGKKSLFEKEICFARDVLYYNNPKYKGFIMFDEIFHSTNPPDGIKTANKFLNKLWSYNHVASIVSTHVFEIIEESPLFVEKICVKAHRLNNKLIYDYKIQKGICKESSVEEIWIKNFDAGSSE
jgi:DNA mismatch repair ATPase MutS